MATETTIPPKKTWQKLLIYWQTKNSSKEVYDIALILAVGIFTNRKIYEEELEQARTMLHELLKDGEHTEEIMSYIEMKLVHYGDDERKWHNDQNKIRELIKADEELYHYLLNIFEADDSIDEEESHFEDSIKVSLLRS